MFDNNLTSEGYKIIIDHHLAPYMANFNGGRCRLLQDNAPTHVTDLIFESLSQNNINWVRYRKNFFILSFLSSYLFNVLNK